MTAKRPPLTMISAKRPSRSKGQITVPMRCARRLTFRPETGCIHAGSGRVDPARRAQASPDRRYRARQRVPCGVKRASTSTRRSMKPSRTRWTERDREKPWRMIGLDTNVLLRLFRRGRRRQSVRARRRVGAMTRTSRCLVNSVVLAEFAWALAKKMKRKRGEVARLIEEVMSADDLYIPDRRAAERALAAYRKGKADFPDYLLAEINLELGCTSTATFDASSPRSFRLLPRAVSPPMPMTRNALPQPPSARALRRHVRPDHRRPGPPRRHRTHHRGREGFHHLRRGGEVRRRQGDPRRHGPGAGDQRRGRGRHRHHQRADHRSLGHRQGRHRHQGRPHRRPSARPAIPTSSPASPSSSGPAPK